MIWAPEPKPRFMFSTKRRFTVRRIAAGYALYDHALGEFISKHFTMAGALRAKRTKIMLLRQTCDNSKSPR